MGDVTLAPPTADVANAIYRAVGVKLKQLSLSPVGILDNLWNGNQ